jgi:3-oxoacyl-(acyl-carrier-protein) synthase
MVVVTGYGSMSPAGTSPERVEFRYRSGKTAVRPTRVGNEEIWAARLDDEAESELQTWAGSLRRHEKLYDRAAILAAAASDCAARHWQPGSSYAVVMGTARGAAGLTERYLSEFTPGRRVSPFASPLTTTGGLASLAAAALSARLGPATTAFVISQTCVSGLTAVATAAAMIRAGVVERALAGGAEAPLTPFTVAAVRATGVYSRRLAGDFPCRPMGGAADDGMVLGEGAAVFALERARADVRAMAAILGAGFGAERPEHLAAMSADGAALQSAMKTAIAAAGAYPDLVVVHAPGTHSGDAAELAALRAVWGARPLPMIYAPKWLTGHALGAAPALALELALLMLQSPHPPNMPYDVPGNPVSRVRSVMVNAAGFGGAAASLILGPCPA